MLQQVQDNLFPTDPVHISQEESQAGGTAHSSGSYLYRPNPDPDLLAPSSAGVMRSEVILSSKLEHVPWTLMSELVLRYIVHGGANEILRPMPCLSTLKASRKLVTNQHLPRKGRRNCGRGFRVLTLQNMVLPCWMGCEQIKHFLNFVFKNNAFRIFIFTLSCD